MKLTTIFLLAACLQLSAKGVSQTVSITVKDVPLLTVLKEIKKQTGYFYLADNEWLQKAKNVTLVAVNWPLQKVLDECFKGQPLTYNISGKVINIVPREETPKGVSMVNEVPPIDVRGRVVNENGEPVSNATVTIKGTKVSTSTNANGEFALHNIEQNAVLIFTHISMESFELQVGGTSELVINLKTKINSLDEIKIIGYGTTTHRLATGNVEKVTSETIAQQPVTNPLQALEGRVAGLQITQSSGLPGGAISVQIRGRNSIGADNNVLYVIDGVPFISNPIEKVVGTGNNSGAGSPLNTIDPNDIESIEVLKDADATAIYGSRASNGVILITTKRGKPGKTKFDFKFNTGIGSATHLPKTLNTEQYLQFRKDAFQNSGLTPNSSNAPDLVLWDQNDYTDWQKWYLGNNAGITDASASIGGGDQQFTFLLGGAYHHETTILPTSNRYDRANFHMSLGHTSINKRLQIGGTAFFTSDKTKLRGIANNTIYNIVRSVPNYPTYDSVGNLNWTGGLSNNIAQLTAYYKEKVENLNGDINASYNILQNLTIKGSLGYNRIQSTQIIPNPSTSFNPSTQPKGNTTFANQSINTFLFEPQILFNKNVSKGHIDLLAGSTIQKRMTQGEQVFANNYSSDLLIESLSFGTVTFANTNSTEYKYLSFFGRATLNWDNTYIINGNFRRDGSSRFGPGKQFGNFGSVGAAWIFSNENFIKKNLRFISFSKLRGSYGTTGNDGIGDYGYLSLYNNSQAYGSSNTIVPSQIANTNYQWEVNKKLEISLDLGFINDRFFISTTWYRNRTGNQLVGFPLPGTTGFASYQANLPAVVQNAGWEFELNTTNFKSKKCSWTTSVNVTIPKNKLISFPSIEKTSYANSLIIGQPINVIQRFHFIGVDPQTGLPLIDDLNNDGVYTFRSSYNNQGGDLINVGATDPKWFGGLSNSITFKNFKFDFLVQYTKQTGFNFNKYAYYGGLLNTWVDELGYWKKPGDVTNIPKPLATFVASTGIGNYINSDATVGDASFLRLKNVELSYSFPTGLLRKINLKSLHIFVQGQNVWTITSYKGYDPETATYPSLFINMPALKVFSVGINCSL